jgi:hypothetical protein
MRLLVGGDSFAQRPKDEDNTHWCELLALEHSVPVDFVAVGGADISTTTLKTIQAILSEQYTHCVFFITDWFRDVVHAQLKDIHSKFDYITPTNFYSSLNLPSYCFTRNVFTEHTKYRFTGYFNLIENSSDQLNYKELLNYMQLKADFTYTHDHLSNLSMLANVAKEKNVKLMLVEVFSNTIANNVDDFATFIPNLRSSVFNYFNSMGTSQKQFYQHKDNEPYKQIPSHHGAGQHKHILALFRYEKPNWLT